MRRVGEGMLWHLKAWIELSGLEVIFRLLGEDDSVSRGTPVSMPVFRSETGCRTPLVLLCFKNTGPLQYKTITTGPSPTL